MLRHVEIVQYIFKICLRYFQDMSKDIFQDSLRYLKICQLCLSIDNSMPWAFILHPGATQASGLMAA